MAVTNIAYAAHVDLTFTTLQSLGTSATAGAASLAVDNTSNKYVDALLGVTLVIGAGTIGNDSGAHVYVYSTEETVYEGDGEMDGSDQAITAGSVCEPLMHYLGIVAMPTASKTYHKVFGSVAMAFGGVMPLKWGIYIRNYCGIALEAAGNNVEYLGITYTTA